jgi:hypothetical protein
VVSYAALAVFKASLAARVCCRLSTAANVTARKEKNLKNTHHSQLLHAQHVDAVSQKERGHIILSKELN